MNSLAEHPGGRMASGAIRTFSHAIGHVDFVWMATLFYLWSYGTVSFPDEWPPILTILRCAINQPCVDMQEMNL